MGRAVPRRRGAPRACAEPSEGGGGAHRACALPAGLPAPGAGAAMFRALRPVRCLLRRPLASGPAPGLPLRRRAAVVAAAAAAAGAGWLYLREEKERRRRARRREELQALALGQAEFRLLDQAGRPRSRSDFHGQWVLLYFGFTHCPDVCPEELEKLGRAVELLDGEAGLPPVQPLFVTVDPERDDAAALARYLRDFHPRLLGLTGSGEEVRAVGRAFRVYARAGPPDEDGAYAVDHSVLIYLLGPDGLFRDCYGRAKTAEHIARSVRQHMRGEATDPPPPRRGINGAESAPIRRNAPAARPPAGRGDPRAGTPGGRPPPPHCRPPGWPTERETPPQRHPGPAHGGGDPGLAGKGAPRTVPQPPRTVPQGGRDLP
ncbi:protein SCO2 homolog, mitochondrial [Opisthocomus hoazin]|uniref:protein SCO2 homolog, mitochondrial n=1 Tax=Opisthocomus hoazin TaxID=30419 RepID=UPI003F52DBA3